MKETAHQFGGYLKLLAKKWILWIFVVLDAIGVIADLAYPELNLPQPIYWGLACVGLLWAGFQVYRDLVTETPPSAILEAVRALNSADPAERRAAIETLAQMSVPMAREALAEANAGALTGRMPTRWPRMGRTYEHGWPLALVNLPGHGLQRPGQVSHFLRERKIGP